MSSYTSVPTPNQIAVNTLQNRITALHGANEMHKNSIADINNQILDLEAQIFVAKERTEENNMQIAALQDAVSRLTKQAYKS